MGIGTTGPLDALTVGPGGHLRIEHSTPSNYLELDHGGFGYQGLSNSNAHISMTSDPFKINAATSRGIGFYVNGSQKMLMDSTGRFGILTSPGAQLHVVGSIRAQESGDAENFGQLAASSDVFLISSFGTAADSGAIRFKVNDSATDALYLKENGNVGIGTTAPHEALAVVGDVVVSDDTPRNCLRDSDDNVTYCLHVSTEDAVIKNFSLLKGTDDGSTGFQWTDTLWIWDNNDNFFLGSNPETDHFTILNSGFVGIGTTGPLDALTVGPGGHLRIEHSTPSNYLELDHGGFGYQGLSNSNAHISMTSDPFKINAATSRGIGFYVNGSQKMLMDSTGRFGILTSPGAQLHVVGSIRAQESGDAENFGQLAASSDVFLISSFGTAADSGAIRFKVNDSATDALYLKENGNVGIGTTAPHEALAVVGDVVVSDDTPRNCLRDSDDNVTYCLHVSTEDAVIKNFSLLKGTDDGSTGFQWTDTLWIWDNNDNFFLGSNPETDHFTILNSGNVGVGTSSPTSALQMGNDKLIAFDINSGLTASTNQAQGQGALTAQINEISTVANNDDVVTLISAITGITQEIINNGAETLQIFPASGDNLGLGTNISEELEANERVSFVAYDNDNWAKESTTEIIHAEIHDEDNTDLFAIVDAGSDFQSYHTNGLVAGDLADWAFDAGGAGTNHAIASIADGTPSGTDIAVTTGDAHGLAVGDIVSQANLSNTNYVGVFEVKDINSTTIYEVAAVFGVTGTGTMDQAATLEADAVAAGQYYFAYYMSASSDGNNEVHDFQLYKNVTAVTGSKVQRKFGTQNDVGSMAGGGITSISNGDKISLALTNEGGVEDIIIRNLTITLIRL